MQCHNLTVICSLSALSSFLVHSLDCCFIPLINNCRSEGLYPAALVTSGSVAPSDTTAFIEINWFDLHFGVCRCSAGAADVPYVGIGPDQTGTGHFLSVIQFLLLL